MIARLLRPVVWVLEVSASVLLRPFGVREVIAGEGVRSAAELRALVDEAEGAGVIPRAQEELLHNVFRGPVLSQPAATPADLGEKRRGPAG